MGKAAGEGRARLRSTTSSTRCWATTPWCHTMGRPGATPPRALRREGDARVSRAQLLVVMLRGGVLAPSAIGVLKHTRSDPNEQQILCLGGAALAMILSRAYLQHVQMGGCAGATRLPQPCNINATIAPSSQSTCPGAPRGTPVPRADGIMVSALVKSLAVMQARRRGPLIRSHQHLRHPWTTETWTC